jgi:hypothetical protein
MLNLGNFDSAVITLKAMAASGAFVVADQFKYSSIKVGKQFDPSQDSGENCHEG